MTELINQSINYEAVCRTALATPGLLNIHNTENTRHNFCNSLVHEDEKEVTVDHSGPAFYPPGKFHSPSDFFSSYFIFSF